MLSEFHQSLRTLVYERGNIPREDVEIAFDAPLRAWVGARTRPTLNFFLFDIRENTDLRNTSPETHRANGRGTHRVPPRRFDLHYLVSALTTAVDDEHLLIWRTLGVLLKHATLPGELLPDSIRSFGLPVTGKIAEPDDTPRPLDVWSAFENPPRPSLVYVVTVPLDLEQVTSAPLVLTRTTRFARATTTEVEPDVWTRIGGRVRDRSGVPRPGMSVSIDGRAGPQAVTNEAGEFALSGITPGRVTLRVTDARGTATLVPVEVPSDSYDIVAD
jgi:hypothetical protein